MRLYCADLPIKTISWKCKKRLIMQRDDDSLSLLLAPILGIVLSHLIDGN